MTETMIDGSPVPDDESHKGINPATGQQHGYVVLSEGERNPLGFKRPLRNAYVHVGTNPEMKGSALIHPDDDGCGTRTRMAPEIAETMATDPAFYSHTFCGDCKDHFPLDQFMWEGTTDRVGS